MPETSRVELWISLQVDLTIYIFHYLYLLSSDQYTLKNIRFSHFVNDSIQHYKMELRIAEKNLVIKCISWELLKNTPKSERNDCIW